MKATGVLKLPSERLLRSYKNCTASGPGWLDSVVSRMSETYNLQHAGNDAGREGLLLFDEMKIRGGLVFSTSTNNIMGFVDCDLAGMGDALNDVLEEDEQKEVEGETATHMLQVAPRRHTRTLHQTRNQTIFTSLC